MTYIPKVSLDISTTETPTEEMVEGKLIYRKMLKHTATLSAGQTVIAHGVSGMTKMIRLYGSVLLDSGVQFPLLWHHRVTASNYHIVVHSGSTNLVLTIDTAFNGTAGNTLSDPWFVMEYLKT